MADQLHGEDLLRRLSMVAVEVGRTRTVNDAFATAGRGLDALQLKLSVLQFDSGTVTMRFSAGPVDAWGEQLRRPTKGPMAALMRSIYDIDDPVFYEQITELLVPAAKKLGLPLDPRMATEATVKGYGRGILAPLRVAGALWGGLAVSGDGLTPEDLPALTLFVAQLRSALEMVEAIEDLQRRTRELEAVHTIANAGIGANRAPIRLLEVVAEAINSDAAVLHRYDAERNELVLVGEAHGYSGPLLAKWSRFSPTGPLQNRTMSGAELAEGLAVVKGEGFESLATVGLFLEGKPIGLLSLARRTPTEFTRAELSSAEILGGQVAALLERERLHEEGARQVKQLSLLYELSSAGAMAGEINKVTERLLMQMLEAFPADGAALHFLEGKQLRLAGWKMRAGVLPDVPPTAEYLPLDLTNTVGRAALSRTTVALSEGNFPSGTRDNTTRLGIRHLMAVPMTVSNREVGTLSLGRVQDAPFTKEEMRLAESCGTHMGVILEHVRLFDDLKKSYDELARAQAEVVRHERLAALGELAAVMAHEVRNPLGVIFNSVTSLKRTLKPSGDISMLLGIVQEEAERLNRIVGDLLDFARPYEPVRTLLALEPLIESALQSAVQSAHAPQVTVGSEYPDALPLFFVDGHLLRQAVVNLVLNGIQAMPRGGKLAVKATKVDRAGELWARIEVRDEGGGLPKESVDRLFQPFFTTKARGTGLGLAVVKRIVDAHQGEVRAEQIERGTMFVLLIPGGQPRVAVDDDDDEDTLPPQHFS
ncbi:MAG: GAF domain-containing protein [Myxococcaceae bacterium]